MTTDFKRDLGEKFNVSRGISMPLERIMYEGIDAGNMHVYISVSALYRAYSASHNVKAIMIDEESYINGFVEEFNIIQLTLEEYIGTAFIDVYYYINNYQSINKVFKYAFIKTKHTKIQQNNIDLEKRCLERVYKKDIYLIDTLVKGNNDDVIMLTSNPIDLIMYNTFRSLMLLESFTGKIKNRSHWNTKLSSNKKYSNLPFNRFTLQVVGDNNKKLNSLGIRANRLLVNIMNDNLWTTLTTMDKIRYDIMNYKTDDPIKEAFLKIIDSGI